MIKRSNSETKSNTSFRANEALDQQQVIDIQQSFYKQKTSPERSKKPSNINASFVEYLFQDIDNKEGLKQMLSQDESEVNHQKSIKQKEQFLSRMREIRAESANSYNQNNKEMHRNKNSNQWNVNSMSNCNNNQNQINQQIEKKQQQNAYMNGKCVYKIFPNIQLKLPMISQSNSNNNNLNYQNGQNQSNSVNINTTIRPYQLGYSVEHNYQPQHVVGHRQVIKTQQSPRGQVSPYQNNNTQYQNANNLSNGYIAKKYIDKSFEEIVGRVNSENNQVEKLKSKSITESNINDLHYSASKSINGLINQTEVSDFQPQNAFFQQNFPNHKSINSQHFKRKILLKLKSIQQTKNNCQNTQSSNYTISSGVVSNPTNQSDQQKQRLQQDRLINYISCKFNQIDKNLNNKLSKDEIIQFFECNSGSPIQSYKDFEIFIKSNYSMFLLELVQKETEKAGFLNFREFKQLFQDFFMKNAQALENKAVLAIKPLQNTVNFKNIPDQSIQLFQKKRETSSELKNNNQPQKKLLEKRIYSAQKVRNQENEELVAIRQRDNSFDNAIKKQVDSQNQQQQQKFQQQIAQNVQKQEKKLKYDLFSQQKLQNLENQSNSNNQLNQNQNNLYHQHQNNSNNGQVENKTPLAKNQIQKNQTSNQKYYLDSFNASRIPSQNQINNSSFSNSYSENDFQSPKKLNKIYQSQKKQKMSYDQQSSQKSQTKQNESNSNTKSEIDIDKSNFTKKSNAIFRTEQKVRSKSTIRNQSSQSARKVTQNEKSHTFENSQNNLSFNKQFRSNSQQSNYSFDSSINNQLPQYHPKLQKSKFSKESPTQKPQNNRYEQINENEEESEQYVKFIELHQIPISADHNLMTQQQQNPYTIEQLKAAKQEITQQTISNSRNIQNPKNSPPHDKNRLRSLSKESESSKQCTKTKKIKLLYNEEISQQDNQQQSQQKKNQQQVTDIQVDLKQKSNSVSAKLNQLTKEQQPSINQENTKSSSFTEKSINYINEVSQPKYYFTSTQQISDDHSDFKLAFEDQKLNKIIDLQKQPFAPNQKSAIVGMSGSLLLRQYNKSLKVNSPQKKTTLTIHQSNPIIEQNEPSLTEPYEQTLTERQQNLESTKILSPNPMKRKEFECTFRPQSLDKDFKETSQLNILQTESQKTNFNKFQHITSNQLKAQTFCPSPSNSIIETPQYLQLKMLDINKSSENQQLENKKNVLSIPDKKEIKEDNNYSFAQNQPQKNQKIEDSCKNLDSQQILREAQDQNDQNIEKTSQAILNIKEDLINLSNSFKAETLNKNRTFSEAKSGSQKQEQKSKKLENKFEETKIQSMNQIQCQEDDTRKSSATKKQIKSTFSQQFNNSSSEKTQILNNHLDQNCQNFLHKKEVKVLKKPSMKKSSEIAIKQMENEENEQLQEQTENQMKNEETAKFEDNQKILNDITFENNSQMVNAENNRKSSIQQGDLDIFNPQNSLSNSQIL